MTFQNRDGVLVIDAGDRLIASTSSHVLTQKHTTRQMRLTVGTESITFEEDEISFAELIKLLPK